MKLLVLGDFCPREGQQQALQGPEIPAVLAESFQGVDRVVANLECPLTAAPTPILKGGPHLSAPPAVAEAMVRMGIGAVTLANNHIMDHGVEGLRTTLETLEGSGIGHFGAHQNLALACRPFHVKHGEETCLFWGFAEREYAFAEPKSPGAAPADLSLMVRQLAPFQGRVPSIVLLHGGNEHYPYPSPALQDKCRLLIELGALAVICQHSHCVGSYEVWQGGLIVYGQGNFLFDHPPSTRPEWFEGLMVELDISENTLMGFKFHPVFQVRGAPHLSLGTSAQRERLLGAFEERSARIGDPESVASLWEDYAVSKTRMYQSLIFGHNRLMYLANKFLGFSDFRTRAARMNLGNVLRCEAHLEVLRTIYSKDRTTGDGK